MSTLTQEQHKEYTFKEWTEYEYFYEVIEYLKEKNINSFIDIGGCSGEVSRIILDRISSIEYGIIFEPNIENYNFIKENIKNDNISVVNKAVYYGKESINLSIKSEWKNVGSWSVYFNEDYPENSIEVECVDIDSYLKEKEYDFIKIDIEGSEFNLIENSTLLKEVKYIELEIHYHHYEVEHNGGILEYLKNYLPNHEIHYYLSYENDKKPGNVFLVRK